jgi:hypothetical protein
MQSCNAGFDNYYDAPFDDFGSDDMKIALMGCVSHAGVHDCSMCIGCAAAAKDRKLPHHAC